MGTLARLRQAGFVPGISATGGLLIEPASRLTPEQRTFIRAHKVLLLEELRAELAAPEPPPVEAEPLPVAKPEQVCCADCAHSVLPADTDPVYGWRLCGLAIDGSGGFGRADRRCEKWEVGT